MMQRSEALYRAANSSYDVCIIGAGATGAGCALDAQLRGLKTLVIDAGDFGSGTSSASTKLIHGGLRYLQQAVMELDVSHYRLVRQALRERHLMMRNAPNLVRTREFVIPCFSFLEAAYYGVGSKLYDWLSGESSLSSTRWLSRAKSLAAMPCIRQQGLKGTLIYSDGQFDDARYNLALIKSCSAAGGDALNYASVLRFENNGQGRLVAAIVRDAQSKNDTFRVTAKAFVNATGPFSDRVRRLADPDAEERLRLSRGVHILLPLPKDFGDHALLIPKTEDKRLMFAIPWQGRLLVGTTETESDLSDEMMVTRDEAEYLLRHVGRYLSRELQLSDIVSAMVGLRPLVRSADRRDTTKIARDYEIEVGRSGLISVLGGKWTVYRAMAEDAVNAVQRAVTGRTTACVTRTHSLFGSSTGSEDGRAGEVELAAAHGITRETARHLVRKFGTCAGRVLALAREDPSLLSPLAEGSPQIEAEALYAIREEMAISIEDVLSRRLGLQYFDWRLAAQAAPAVARILARELGWGSARARNEIDSYTERISRSLETLGVNGVRTETLN